MGAGRHHRGRRDAVGRSLRARRAVASGRSRRSRSGRAASLRSARRGRANEVTSSRVAPLDDADLEATLLRVPKAELHIHLEGAVRWSTIRELHPDGGSLPETPSWCGQAFADFSDFRRAIQESVIPVTGTAETLERHTFEIVEDLARQNVRYAELIVSHEAHTLRGLADEAIWVA